MMFVCETTAFLHYNHRMHRLKIAYLALHFTNSLILTLENMAKENIIMMHHMSIDIFQ